MPQPKYFAGIDAAQSAQVTASKLDPFDFDVLGGKGPMARLSGLATRALIGPIYAFSRRFMPLLPLAGLVHVTREAQVREILLRPADFITPFGPEMAELGDGATFLLGLEGGEHDRLHAILTQIIRRSDAERIGQMSRDFTNALLDISAGRIDVVADLIKRVPAEICLRYFGLHCDDVDAFGDWTLALSAFLFGDPYGKPETRKLAMNAKRRLAAVLSDALARNQRLVRTGAIHAGNADTLVARLALLQQTETLTDAEIKAILMGLATGFIPTNSLAASNMLMELLKRPDALAAARAAARAGDRATMHRIVLEAGRLNPALAPGQWRYCPRDAEIAIDGKRRVIKAGTTLLVSTMSALRDPRAWDDPGAFRLDRADPDLVFGIGPHWCLGKYLALEQISGLFEALLQREDLRPARGRAGKLERTGPFPRHLVMTYASTAATQSMFLVIAPLGTQVTKYGIDKQIAALGNPAKDSVRAALDRTGLVHFASLATIPADEGLFLSFELSTDGTIEAALPVIAEATEDLLRPIFAHAGLRADEPFAAWLGKHVVRLHGKPWGANGLNYNGLAEFPVAMVEKQARFADFAGRVLRDFIATETSRGSHPSLAMSHLRRILRRDPTLIAEATPAQQALAEEATAHGFDALHLTTDAARLKLARFRPLSHSQALANFLRSRDGRIVVWPLLVLIALFAAIFWPQSSGPLLWQGLSSLARAVLATTLVAGMVVTAFLIMLRRAEATDQPSTAQAPLSKLQAVMAQENHPGHAQNHFMAVGTMKPGLFRAATHAFALWAIQMSIIYAFRPGLIINMGTIHYARWFRLPGTSKVGFYSNFDGSWESYLEDFIIRVRQGQSAAWSNWQGFPRTRFLIAQGAEDGDAFKRFTRNVQQLVPFWYSRFPALTTDQIRNNGLIHAGAGLARSATECEEWVRCFGSMPRVDNRIESDEVQALVFRGMKRLPYSAVLALDLPPEPEALGEWLSWIRGRPMRADKAAPPEGLAALMAEGVLLPVPRPAGQAPEYALAQALTIAFGDRPLTGDSATDIDTFANAAPDDSNAATLKDAAKASAQAIFLGLSARGMARFEAPNAPPGSLLEGFPSAFRMGMAARARINGDFGPDAPSHWRWCDNPDTADGADAALIAYAATPEHLAKLCAIHAALLTNHGGRILSEVPCAPAWSDPQKADFEHFGYRDGISQPVIKGTSRAMTQVPARDQIEAGEFILGYRNTTGYFPPSPLVPPESDVLGALPVASAEVLSRYPDFGDHAFGGGPRDLGRNGTFLVLRELRQDVAGFEAMVDEAARALNQGGLSDLYRLTGQTADRDWIKAKLMGRWPSGRPLIGNPVNRQSNPATLAEETSNDFSYGDDDPQGLACPFGAHIRRTNPRDSKQPQDRKEQIISNRHRLLRRGRTYQRADGEKGLLFAAVCADLERQFEFVQQFWANAPSFHGLTGEPDPISGSDPLDIHGNPIPRHYSIPTPAGPIRLEGLRSHVRMMGGGYFFMPSRSALGWLTEVALHAHSKHREETPA